MFQARLGANALKGVLEAVPHVPHLFLPQGTFLAPLPSTGLLCH
jgi:hypothetical protein